MKKWSLLCKNRLNSASAITPLLSTRCGVNLYPEDRWQKNSSNGKKLSLLLANSVDAHIPELHPVMSLDAWLEQTAKQEAFNLTLDPHSKIRFRRFNSSNTQDQPFNRSRRWLYTRRSHAGSTQAHFNPVQIGPRILRTETAALATLSALQSHWGDL